MHSQAGEGDGSLEHSRAVGPINRQSMTSPGHRIGIVVMKRPPEPTGEGGKEVSV